jgi:hypothetical protein
MKYGDLVVSIPYNSVKIWGFGMSSQKIMASTGVFVLVVSALKDSTIGNREKKVHDLDLNNSQTKPQLPENSLSTEFRQGRQRTKQT